MVYTSNRDGGGSVPFGHLAHPPPEGRLRRTGIFKLLHFRLKPLVYAVDETKNPDLGKESIRNFLARKQNHAEERKPRKRMEHEGR